MAEPLPPRRDPSWFDRLAGVVPGGIAGKRVAIVGCGSVGSFVADELARAGVGHFLLIDPDHVEWRNLTRTVYGHADVGAPKVEALARHLRGIFPDLAVQGCASEVQALRPRLRELLGGVDLVVSALDDPTATGIVDRYCYALLKPAVFVGLYRGAGGGEVIAVDPVHTPCMGCATGGVRETLGDVVTGAPVQRERDYGTNKLKPQVALGSDIHFVCNAAVKIALSMLCGGDENGEDGGEGGGIGRFMRGKLREGVHYLMLAMEPDYYLFPHTHADAIGQYAFQSLWLQTTRRADCPRCGEPGFRQPPF